MNDMWITSDTHYNHKNIVKGVSNWNDKNGCRDFDTLQQHNQVIVDEINKRVKPEDTLIHLGDWSFGGRNSIEEFRSQIHCENIILVLGNHDQHIKKEKKFYLRFFSGIYDVYSFKHNKQTYFCSHYCHKLWDKSHHGVIHLFGHSHGSLDHLDNGRSMDVGVDVAYKLHGSYSPFHIDEIYAYLKDIDPLFIDHHNENTT